MIRAGLLHAGIVLATVSLSWSQTAPPPHSNSDFTSTAKSNDSAGPSSDGAKAAHAPSNQEPDKLLDLPPLKPTRASLMGGALESIDRVRSRLVLRLFGGGKLTIAFDPRTQFLRGTELVRVQDMHAGERVYVETVLDGTAVFAKTVHLPTEAAQGSVQGQVIGYDAGQGSLSVRDQLSSQPVRFRVTSKTIITGNGIAPGALVQLSFLPGENPALVREIKVLIAPGSVFTFSGRITFLDLASDELVLASATDDNRYEIKLNPAAAAGDSIARLQEGATVTIAARFNGQSYVAESVTVLSHPDQ
jgi:hypothetical protein